MKESEIQKKAFKWFCATYPDYIKSFQCSLNGVNLGGGKKAAIIINNLKSQGMCVGQSDVFIAVPKGLYHGAYFELKTLTGTTSDDQIDFGERMVKLGYYFAIVKGLDSTLDGMAKYMSLAI